MVLETKSSLEAGIVGAGHSFAGSRLDAQRSTAGWVSEQMGEGGRVCAVLWGRRRQHWSACKAVVESARSLRLSPCSASCQRLDQSCAAWPATARFQHLTNPLLNLPHDTTAGGVAYLDYIRQLAQRLDSDWEGVQADLEAIR